MRIFPEPHQITKANELYEIFKVKGYAYLAGKPRSGKTYTSILTMEKSKKLTDILVITTKNAFKGWHLFIDDNDLLTHNYDITNFDQVGSMIGAGRKKKIHLKITKVYKAVIIDESHNMGTVGKPSNRYLIIKAMCKDLPHIHLSGTAIVESIGSIYYQMNISKFSPFKHKTFYDFFREWGIPNYMMLHGRQINQYNKYKPELLEYINTFTVYMTQEYAGISKSMQAVDKIHYVKLKPSTAKLYNQLQDDKIAEVWSGMLADAPNENSDTLICDSVMKLRISLHMLESGLASIPYYENDKRKTKYIELGNTEKIDYILQTFGDTDKVGIMSHFIAERKLLKAKFKHAHIYSSKADAEGTDMSHLEHFIIISQDYSGAKHIQRRERVVNMNGSVSLIVNYILVHRAISDQAYKTTSKKKNFNDSTYDSKRL